MKITKAPQEQPPLIYFEDVPPGAVFYHTNPNCPCFKLSRKLSRDYVNAVVLSSGDPIHITADMRVYVDEGAFLSTRRGNE